MILLLFIRMDKYQLLLKVLGKNERLVFNSLPLNMVFRFSYFDEINRIQLQLLQPKNFKRSNWTFPKISFKPLLKFTKRWQLFQFFALFVKNAFYLTNIFQFHKYQVSLSLIFEKKSVEKICLRTTASLSLNFDISLGQFLCKVSFIIWIYWNYVTNQTFCKLCFLFNARNIFDLHTQTFVLR